MINDISFLVDQEQPLDVWIFGVLAVVNDVMYEIFIQLYQAQDEVDKYVS